MKIHIVQKGDTLWKISKKYGVDFEELKQMNSQLSNPDMLMPGMKIKIPSGNVHVKKEVKANLASPVKEMAKKEEDYLSPIKEMAKKEVKAEHPYKDISPKALPVMDVPKKENIAAPKAPYVPKMPKLENLAALKTPLKPMMENIPMKENIAPTKPKMPMMENIPMKENIAPTKSKMPMMENIPMKENIPPVLPNMMAPLDELEPLENIPPKMPILPISKEPMPKLPYCKPVSPVLPGSGLHCPPGMFPGAPGVLPGVPGAPGVFPGAPGAIPTAPEVSGVTPGEIGGVPPFGPTSEAFPPPQGYQPPVSPDWDDDIDLPPAPPWGAPLAPGAMPMPGQQMQPGFQVSPYGGFGSAAPMVPGQQMAPGVGFGGYPTVPQGPVGASPMREEGPMNNIFNVGLENDLLGLENMENPAPIMTPMTAPQAYQTPYLPPMITPALPAHGYKKNNCGCGGPSPLSGVQQGFPMMPPHGYATPVPQPYGYSMAPMAPPGVVPGGAPGMTGPGMAPGFAGGPQPMYGVNPYYPARSMPYNPMFTMPEIEDESDD